jgi:UDP-N-acetylglucosamine 1-carboxyvinyltransferase
MSNQRIMSGAMGSDPHRAIVSGPSRLRAARLEGPDIRAGVAMLLAAMCADAVSTIDNAPDLVTDWRP